MYIVYHLRLSERSIVATYEIRSEMIPYPTQDGTPIRGYLSQPTTPGAYPGIVVIVEAFGLVEHIIEHRGEDNHA